MRKLTGGGKVSLGSFSEAASVFDPERLAPLIEKFKHELRDERSRERLEAGHAVTASPLTDSLAERLTAVDGGGDYVARINRNEGRAIGDPAELSEAASTPGVIADEWIEYGESKSERVHHPLRRVTLLPPADRPSAARQGRPRTDQTGRDELVLVTTLLDTPAEGVVALYEERWTVELFFRFLKHTLGCQKLLSTKTEGVQLQLYYALIAALLLALACGRSITKRQFEMVCLKLTGWADDGDLAQAFGLLTP